MILRVIAVIFALALSAHLLVAPAQAQETQPVPLLELINAQGDGRLYTLSQSEAEAAVARYGFQPVPTPPAYMWRDALPGTQPIYRLRYHVRPSYLLTASIAERDSLVAGGQFDYEGIVGYTGAMTGPAPPGQTTLWRYSKDGVGWPVVVDSRRAALESQGLHRDGPLGYVYENPPPSAPPPPATAASGTDPCNPTPAAADLKVRVAASSSRRAAGTRVMTVRYQARHLVRGRVLDAGGKPVSGAPICVSGQSATLGAKPRRVAALTAGKDGRFTYRLPAATSQRFVFVYRLPDRAASEGLLVQVRAPVSLASSKRNLLNGQAVTLRGRVRGHPGSGVLVELQVKRGRRWQTFGTTNTTPSGRYRYVYRFTRSVGSNRYAFRARVPQQRGYPFAAGASHGLTVRVSGNA